MDGPITVVETAHYETRARKRMTQEERDNVIWMIANDPHCGAVIRGTGGIRKVRYATQGRGKSGGVRVIYFFHNERIPLFLLDVYAKNEKANLSQAERNAMAKLVDEIRKEYGV